MNNFGRTRDFDAGDLNQYSADLGDTLGNVYQSTRDNLSGLGDNIRARYSDLTDALNTGYDNVNDSVMKGYDAISENVAAGLIPGDEYSGLVVSSTGKPLRLNKNKSINWLNAIVIIIIIIVLLYWLVNRK